jgi:DNA-directed RNA polymerase subunit RPC12/RpoP
MKKLTAKRSLRRTCIECGRKFNKGDVYYRHREVAEEYGEIFAYEYIECPKCHHKQEHCRKRFEEFKKRCLHPDEFITTVWSYIPGECVKEPDYDYCRLCGTRF